MKPIIFLLFVLIVAMIPAHAQLQTEKRSILFPLEHEASTMRLQPGNAIEREVTFEQATGVRRQLRVVGGIQMPGKFAPRGEEFFRQQEYLPDDHLDSLRIYKDRYSLYFKGENDLFGRYAYNRLTSIQHAHNRTEITIAYRRKNLAVRPDGDFGIQLQLYYKKEGRHPDDVYDKPDSILYIPVPPGSGDFKVLRKKIRLPKNVTNLLMRVGGSNFSGECWLEAPQIYQNDKRIFCSPFIQHSKIRDTYNYWVGVNLSTRSWPKWKLVFQGSTLYEGNIFDRASNIADFYIPLPQHVSGRGKLTLTLEKEPYGASFPYELRSIQLLEENAADFEIITVPRFVTIGDTTAILIETNKPGTTLNFSTTSANVKVIDHHTFFEKPGLHAIQCIAIEVGAEIPIEISDGSSKKTGKIAQIVIKEKDKVYLSSGDEIHIDKTYPAYDPFFKWYMQHRIGNFYQFRPSYQWSGVRITDENVIGHYTALLQKMNMPYAWQVEGRTLAATNINPTSASLQSPMFKGNQAHENDGGYYYWQHFLYKGLYSDIAARTRPYGGIFAKHRPIYTDHGIFIHYDPYSVKDMADGAAQFVANLQYSRGESTRHTGPSTMFRYFYQAGYQWLGAEQMYGPEDVIMSSLRGAARAYHRPDYGSLHAVQWGSAPFTDPKHALRHFLSLAVAYIHGSSHINTEEGLWTDEYSNDRYTLAGKQHLYAQHQVLDYIETHARMGHLNTKIAIIQGRNDAWKSFGRGSIWSQKDNKWAFNKAMESFDLLKVFYPDNNLDICSTEGLFTSTPYGPIDILPIEAPSDVLHQYQALIFLGWNTFDSSDFARIKDFVSQGGKLLLSAAHFNSELQPHLPAKFPKDDAILISLLGVNYKEFKGKTMIPLGKGTIIYYPEPVYPADGTIRSAYKQDMEAIANDITLQEYEKGWIKSSPNVDFSVWDSGSFRTLYLLNVDWKSKQAAQKAVFVYHHHPFTIDVERYKILTIRCAEGIATMLNNNTSDILKIEKNTHEWKVTCQTTGADKLTVFDGNKGGALEWAIDSPGVHTLIIPRQNQ